MGVKSQISSIRKQGEYQCHVDVPNVVGEMQRIGKESGHKIIVLIMKEAE